MNRIVPNLWFDDQSEEATTFYTSIFANSRIGHIAHYTEAGKEIHGHNAGDVLTVEFEIENTRFIALNGGPQFKINPSISFFVRCSALDEVNDLWQKLSEGASVLMPLGTYPFSQRYGWLSDKFGVSWQLMLSDQEIAQKITPSLMFTKEQAGKAEEALNFYASVFPDSKVGTISRYTAEQEPDKEGTVTYGELTILGQLMSVMDSARMQDFSFNEAVSLMVECETQEEIDDLWQKLSAVPEAEVCGWLKDKYGVSWQIVPTIMHRMLKEGTSEQLERVTAAYMKMKKFDIAELERTYNEAK